MNCRKVRELLIAFLGGELPSGGREQVQEHLKGCPACTSEKELLIKSWQALENYPVPKLKDDFTLSLMRKIHLEQAEFVRVKYSLPQFAFRRLVPVLASVFILVLAVSLFWKKGEEEKKLARTTPEASREITRTQEIASVAIESIADKEIIRNLELYENAELLENLNLIVELDVVESLEGPVS